MVKTFINRLKITKQRRDRTRRTWNTTEQEGIDGFNFGTNYACLQRHGQTAHRLIVLTQTYAITI
jgi:hypothetical protein